MSGKLVATVEVGAILAGLILTGSPGLQQDMARLESRLDGKSLCCSPIVVSFATAWRT